MKLRQLCMCILVLLFSLEEGSTLLRRFHARTSSLSKVSPSDTLASLAIAIMTCPLLVTPQNAYAAVPTQTAETQQIKMDTREDAIDEAALDSFSYENEISRRKYIEEALRTVKATKEPQNEGLIERIEKNLVPTLKKREISVAELTKARDVVLTLKPYLDEAERDIQMKNWDNLQVYLFTFAEQEKSFSLLIDGLFPAEDDLDTAARTALSYQAQQTFILLDQLREYAKDRDFRRSENTYARLLLSYDRFLKAGDLYPTYDVITSTEVFYRDKDTREQIRYKKNQRPMLQDSVLLISGPDMGKTGRLLDVDDEDMTIVEFDSNGNQYQEVKQVKMSMLGKVIEEDDVGKFTAPKVAKNTDPFVNRVSSVLNRKDQAETRRDK